jgi:FkbM family methyltransferase
VTRVRQFLRRIAFSALARFATSPWGAAVAAALEKRFLARMMRQTMSAGPEGRAVGGLFHRHEPSRSAAEIYDDVFSPRRFEQGYHSQVGQDLFLNRWFFKDRGPGFFVDVGAYDGTLGSNTYFFEKRLGWRGVAFEPNAPAFEAMRKVRSCQTIQGCAYDHDGEVSFLALSGKGEHRRSALRPTNLSSMVFDPSHGALMLSGIHDHIDSMPRVDQMSHFWSLDKTLVTVPCHRIDTVLNAARVTTVDYLSIDVEGAELHVLKGIDFDRVRVNVIAVERSAAFSEVYELLIRAGFDYHGLLFFDEVFVNRKPRFSWEQQPGAIEGCEDHGAVRA